MMCNWMHAHIEGEESSKEPKLLLFLFLTLCHRWPLPRHLDISSDIKKEIHPPSWLIIISFILMYSLQLISFHFDHKNKPLEYEQFVLEM